MEDSEKLLAKVMSSLNSIIEEQARSHSCVPLRPDLQEFYNMIIQFNRDQNMVRDKRHLNTIKSQEDLSYPLYLIDPYRIEKQTKIVKGMLRKYEKLEREDQEQFINIREELLRNILVLQKLQGDCNNEEKLKRHLSKGENCFKISDVDERVIKDLSLEYTEEYLKLLKAAKTKRVKNGEGEWKTE